jgi:GNAT superfamily N-acetyltransferase
MLGDPAYRKAVSDNQDVVDFDCQTFTKGDGMEAMPLWRCTLMPMSGPRCGRVTADTGLMTEALRVTACDTDETLAAASILFNEYRHHYGQSPDGDERTLRWLIEMVRSNMLTVYTAFVVSAVEAAVIGLATAHPIPASLVMGCSWQLRDLYVLPKFRRHGAAAALVNGVREAALAAGAIRLSLVTEPDSIAALGLYRSLGFRPLEGVTSLSLDLTTQDVAG